MKKKPSVLMLCRGREEILSALIVFVLYKKQKEKDRKDFCPTKSFTVS